MFPDQNELLIKGALPGARGSLLLITTPEGKMQIDVMPFAETVAEAAPEEAVEAPVAETSAEATEQTA